MKRAPLSQQALPSSGRCVLATREGGKSLVWIAVGEAAAEHVLGSHRLDSAHIGRVLQVHLSLPQLLHGCAWGRVAGHERILGVWLHESGFDLIFRHAIPDAFDPARFTGKPAWRLAKRYAASVLTWHPDVDGHGQPHEREVPVIGMRRAACAELSAWVSAVEDHGAWVVANRDVASAAFPVVQPVAVQV